MPDERNSLEQLMAMRDMDEIFALEDDTDFVTALSSALWDRTESGKHLDAVSPEARVFYLCNALDAEVNNGGFSAFFYNPSGQWGPETIDALETVGAPGTAELLRRFIALLPCDGYPRDIAVRNDVLLEVPDTFDANVGELDDEFYAGPDGSLQALYVTYARDHRDDFS